VFKIALLCFQSAREKAKEKEKEGQARAGEREPRVKESNVENETPRVVRERSELRAH